MTMNSNATIREAREFLDANLEEGCECPVCGQHAQLYDYKLFSTSATALILLYKLHRDHPEEDYFHISRYAEAQLGKARAPHFAELRFWGLIEKKPNTDDSKKASGFWRITNAGREFVEMRRQVQSRILVFNNQFRGYSDKSEWISIKDALQNQFDYKELMGEYHSRGVVKEINWLRDEQRDAERQEAAGKPMTVDAVWQRKGHNGFKLEVGKTYELIIQKLRIGHPVVVTSPYGMSYKDISAFQRDWRIV